MKLRVKRRATGAECAADPERKNETRNLSEQASFQRRKQITLETARTLGNLARTVEGVAANYSTAEFADGYGTRSASTLRINVIRYVKHRGVEKGRAGSSKVRSAGAVTSD